MSIWAPHASLNPTRQVIPQMWYIVLLRKIAYYVNDFLSEICHLWIELFIFNFLNIRIPPWYVFHLWLYKYFMKLYLDNLMDWKYLPANAVFVKVKKPALSETVFFKLQYSRQLYTWPLTAVILFLLYSISTQNGKIS